MRILGLDLEMVDLEAITFVVVGDGRGGLRGDDSAREVGRFLRRTRGRLASTGEM